MRKFDDYSSPPEKKDYPPTIHEFRNTDGVIYEYADEICNWIIDYGRQGFFIEGFAGKYNISQDSMTDWLNAPKEEFIEFKAAVKLCMSAAIHYWQEELMNAINNDNYDRVGIIKSVLSDLMRITPKSLRELQFANLEPAAAPDNSEKKKDDHLSFMAAMSGTKE